MPESKPLNEIPAARTRRVLGRLRLPEGSAIVWLGLAVALLIGSLVAAGFLVARPATGIFGGYVEQLRDLDEGR